MGLEVPVVREAPAGLVVQVVRAGRVDLAVLRSLRAQRLLRDSANSRRLNRVCQHQVLVQRQALRRRVAVLAGRVAAVVVVEELVLAVVVEEPAVQVGPVDRAEAERIRMLRQAWAAGEWPIRGR